MRTRTFSVRAAPELVDAIDDLAAARGWTRATFILHALGVALADDYGRFRRVPRSLAAIRLHRLFLDSAERAMTAPEYGSGQGRQRRRARPTSARIRNPERVYTERMTGRKVTSVRLTDEQRDTIDRQAAERNMTRSEWLEAAIDRGIDYGEGRIEFVATDVVTSASRRDGGAQRAPFPRRLPLPPIVVRGDAVTASGGLCVPTGERYAPGEALPPYIVTDDELRRSLDLNEDDMIEGRDDLEPS